MAIRYALALFAAAGLLGMAGAQVPLPPPNAAMQGTAAPAVQGLAGPDRTAAEVVFGVEYVLAFPQRGNMDFALPNPNFGRAPVGAIQSLDWGASNGVRLSAGWRPAGSLFDVAFSYTYLYGHDQQSAFAPPGGQLYTTQTRPGFVDDATSAQASSRLSYNVYDLGVGRTIPLDSEFSLRLSTGVRIAAIYQNVNALYNGLQADNAQTLQQNSYVGGGLTAGGEARWALSNHFTLFGRVGGAILSGQQNTLVFESNHSGATVDTNVTDRVWQVVPVVEVAAGVTWQRNGYSVSVGFEMTNWFGLVNRPQFIDSSSEGSFTSTQSDLSVEAIYFRFAKTF
jgi:hypothetical protein